MDSFVIFSNLKMHPTKKKTPAIPVVMVFKQKDVAITRFACIMKGDC